MALSKVTQISGFSCVEDISRTARYYCVRFKDRCIKENFTPIEYIQKQWLNNKNVSLIVHDWEEDKLFSFGWSDRPLDYANQINYKDLFS